MSTITCRKVLVLRSLRSCIALESSQSELFDLKSRYDEDSHAKSDEMEIIMTDLERANQRAVLAEKEVNQLKEQLTAATRSLQLADQIQKAPDMEQAITILTRSSLEMELAAKEKEISQLMNDIQQLQSTVSQLKETSASQIARLEEQLEEKSRRIQNLEDRLNVQQDYEDMKRELNILKSVEFASPSEGEGGAGAQNKPLEVLLLQKNKTLQAENTTLKVGTADLQGPPHLGLPGPAPGPGPGAPFPPSLQTVETFGSLLGEEIVASWHQCEVRPPPSSSTDVERTTPNVVVAAATVGSSAPVEGVAAGAGGGAAAAVCVKGCPLPNGLPAAADGPHPPALPPKVDRTKTTSVERMALERLQELLRQNIEKHANDTLNTMNISRRVRELLSIHNIGQRLFAKYILGLSQGTVSELLSKPKPWDKLTEKGRDSYRKMHAWACDDSCVMVLKSLVPRKGKDPGLPSCYRSDDVATEERIAIILNEAQHAMKTAASHGGVPHHHALHHSHLGASVPDDRSSNGSETSKLDSPLALGPSKEHYGVAMAAAAAAAASGRRVRKYENDDIPQEMVAKIYQEELAKLMGRTLEEGGMMVGGAASGLPFTKDQYQRTQEEIRLALNVYHQELSRLTAQQMQAENGVQDLSLPKGERQQQQQQHHHHHQQQQQQRDVAERYGRRDNDDEDDEDDDDSRSPNGKLVNGSEWTTLTSMDRRHRCRRRRPVSLRLDRPDSSFPTGSQDVPSERERSRTPRERNSESPLSLKADGMRHVGSAFSLVRPKIEPGLALGTSSPPPNAALALTVDDVASPACTAASPLQRMQSITNSLISQPSLPSMPSLPQRPLKAVLPPITQYQFDQYTNLNTEDIVKKVKEQLSQFSISQRLFGESVLGLSQGSVSDLLARPKPWHMLTQKGREPFIRMKIFLEDENAVHKLVASQYKIAPEKLMRTGSAFGPSPPAGTSKHHSSMKDLEGLKHGGSYDGGGGGHHHHHHHHHHPGHPHHPSQSSVTVSQVHLPGLMNAGIAQDLTRTSISSMEASAKKSVSAAAATAAAVYRAVSHLQPSVYEMAALTQDLDTQMITTKIKETLLANNIGQKIFGEAVLGLSQGSVSELLSKPKPWHMLSIKGREPFIRMQLWLSDPHNVDRLQALKNERREANKRRRSNVDYLEGMETLENNNHIHHGNGTLLAPSPIGPTPKKPRVLFSEEQKEALRIAFALDPYPSTSTIEFLAQELTLTARTITNWFHNHRMRLKQQVPHTVGSSPRNSGSEEVVAALAATAVAAAANGREGSTFDATQFRALLNQRLVDLQKEKSGMMAAGSLGSLPYSYYSNSSSPLSGLDLSISSSCHGSLHVKHEPRDLEVDSNLSSEYNDDSDSSKERGYVRAGIGVVVEHGGSERRMGAGGGSSSRRKPAAPQWVNPGWDAEDDAGVDDIEMEDDDDKSDDGRVVGDETMDDVDADESEAEGRDKGDEVIINGVCVRQTRDFDLPSHEEETVHVEPAPAPDHESTSDAPVAAIPRTVRTSRASSTAMTPSPPHGSAVSSPGVAAASRCGDYDDVESTGCRSLGDDSADESNRDRLVNIERLEKSLHEQEESWDGAEETNEERQSNIEKLQQRIQKEEAEEWEF